MAKTWELGLRGDSIRFTNGGLNVQARPMFTKSVTIIADRPYLYPRLSETEVAPICYFEVTLTKLPAEATVYIGFADSNVNTHLFALKQTKNTYLLSNLGNLHNVGSTFESYSKPFVAGDTVGAGVCFDSYNQRRFFFTLNGEILKATEPYFGSVAHGMEALPLVHVTGATVDFTSNFTGTKEPWKAQDAVKRLLMQPHKENYIGSLPEDVLKLILPLAAPTHLQAGLILPQVCKKWNEIAACNDVWKGVYLKQWGHQNPNLKIKNWKKFFQGRFAIFGSLYSTEFQIENCSFEFECPFDSRVLKSSDKPNEKNCEKCGQTVVIVQTDRELSSAVALGKCVALAPRRKLRGKVKIDRI